MGISTQLLAAALLAMPSAAFAQIGDAVRPGSASAALEIIRPTFHDGSGVRFATAAAYLSGHVDLSPGARLILELPVSRASTDDGFGDGTGIGNPYIGLQFVRRLVTYDLGLRMPLASDEHGNATAVGMVADIERIESFLPDVATVRAAVNARTPAQNGVSLGISAGSAFLVRTEDGLQDSELLLGYGTDIGLHTSGARMGARFSGRWNVTEEGSFADRTLHQLGAFVEFGSGRVRPGLQVRVPLDSDMRENVPWIAGASIQVALR